MNAKVVTQLFGELAIGRIYNTRRCGICRVVALNPDSRDPGIVALAENLGSGAVYEITDVENLTEVHWDFETSASSKPRWIA